MAAEDEIGSTQATAEQALTGAHIGASMGLGLDAARDLHGIGPASEELGHRLRQHRFLVEYGLFALRATERDALYGECVRIAAEGLDVRLAKYLEYRPATDDLLIRAGIGWDEGIVGHATLSADAGSPAGYAFHKQTPVISNHLGSEDRFRTPEVLVRHGVRRAVNVPVRDEEKPIGVLEVDSPAAGRFTEADIAFLDGLSLMVSAATGRLAAIEALHKGRERERLLIGEMRHRVRNIFALMQGIVSMSVREARRGGEDVVDLIVGRLDALSAATETGLPRVAEDGTSQGQRRDLLDLTRRVLAPYGDRVVIAQAEGLPSLADRFQTVVALLLHELATNAVKHGALAGAEGRVEVAWHAEDASICLDWRESGAATASVRGEVGSGGFGTGMIDALLTSARGTIQRDMGPDGLHVTATIGTD